MSLKQIKNKISNVIGSFFGKSEDEEFGEPFRYIPNSDEWLKTLPDSEFKQGVEEFFIYITSPVNTEVK